MREGLHCWNCIFITLGVALTVIDSTATAAALQGPPGGRPTQKTSSRPQRAPLLEPGTTVETDLARGESHAFRVRLDAGQFLHLEVVPKGIALEIDVADPRGVAERHVQSPYTSEGPLAVFLVAATAGRHKIQVRATDRGGLGGELRIALSLLSVASREDRARSAGQRRLGEGMRLYQQGKSDALGRSIAMYEQAVELWAAAGDGRGRADTLIALGRALHDLGENPRALSTLQTAVESHRTLGDLRGQAAALHNLGEAADAIGDERDAIAYYTEALAIRESLGDRLAEAETLNNIGVVYDSTGDKPRALEYLERSRALKDALDLQHLEGTLLNNIGWVRFTMGDMESALETYRQALPLRRAEGDLNGVSVTLTNIGSVYLTLGDARTARAYFARAQPIADRVGNKVWLATLANNIGFAFFDAGDFDRALVKYRQALALRRAAGDKAGEAVTLNNIARVYGRLSDTTHEGETYQKALELIREVGDRRWEANILNNIGKLHDAAGDGERAAAHYDNARDLTRRIGDERAEAVAVLGLARIEAGRGDFAKATRAAESVLSIVESLRRRVATPSLRASYFARLREPYEFYVDLLMEMDRRTPGAGHSARALEVAERGRARSLLDTLNEMRAPVESGVDLDLLNRERTLWRSIEGKREARVVLLSRADTDEAATMVGKELDELRTQYREVQATIRRESPRHASLIQPNPLSISEIQGLLDAETLLLEYAVGAQRSYVWAVAPETMAAFELPGRPDIDAAVRRVYTALTERNRPIKDETFAARRRRLERAAAALSEGTARLSQMLLGPVASLLGNRRLAIVTDETLQYIPFGALPMPVGADPDPSSTPETDRPPLVVDHEIVRLPSASVLGVLRSVMAARPRADKAVAVLADPVYDRDDPRVTRLRAPPAGAGGSRGSSGRAAPSTSRIHEQLLRSAAAVGAVSEGRSFPRLMLARREAKAIIQATAETGKFEALDFAASRATALSPDLSRYRIVHFASHALLNSERPELSGLVLSLVDEQGRPQDGFLELQDVYNLKWSADLVTLSACETALGKEVKGEGPLALSRGFMHAGVPRLVASLWKVDDLATAELMNRFYRRVLKDGKRPAAALREAQIDMWHDERWRSPYYWSGFEFVGEWR
jgi:CHAT domain-containing protein/tetratricopeptide (TPR) repeat protein